jgi:hypothetical protein
MISQILASDPPNKQIVFLLSSALGKKFRDTFCRERGIPSPRFFLIVQINSKPAKRKSRIIYSNFLVSKVYVATLGWPAFLLSVHKARRGENFCFFFVPWEGFLSYCGGETNTLIEIEMAKERAKKIRRRKSFLFLPSSV